MSTEMIVNIVLSAIAFIFVFLFFYIRDMRRLKSKKKKVITEVKYLMLRNNIKEEYLLNKGFLALTAFINAFIISAVFFFIEVLHWHILFKLMLGFVLTLALIYSIYGILGNILEKRSEKK